MSITSELLEQVTAVTGLLGADLAHHALPATVDDLDDERVVALLRSADALARGAERVRIVAAGVVAARSTRDAGHRGLAQSRGHRSPVSLVQALTGATRAEAQKQVRIGEALREGQMILIEGSPDAGAPDPVNPSPGADGADPDAAGQGRADLAPLRAWHAPLSAALLAGAISSAQHDVILRGLGEPPVPLPAVDGWCAQTGHATGDLDGDGSQGDPGGGHGDECGGAGGACDRDDAACHGDGCDRNGTRADRCGGCSGNGACGGSCSGPAADEARRAVSEAWALAAEQLTQEAPHRTVEELARLARMIRDQLDPEGAARRFQERFDARSFRLWTDADGCHRGSLVLDDFGAAWVRSIIDAALRPRRNGPRFIDPDEKARADELAADPRSNDQLAYDLILDVLRAGALADPETVFGTRQAGVRLVQVVAAADAPAPIAHTEDGLTMLPGWLAEQHRCDTAAVPCRIDPHGNPLDLGREQRLFSPRQRIALAVRDGGCRWRGCDRPASYCEAHHIDPFAGGGRTDIDRGVLLCRYHHMALHNGGWRITRQDRGDFVLHPPGPEPPIPLGPRLALTYAWAGIDAPPRRFRPAA